MTKRALHARSLAAQAMGKIDPLTKAVVPPIHVATTYIRDEDNRYSSGFIYGRPDNETTREAESVLAMLEEAKAGAPLFGSGMAAATAVFQTLSPGDQRATKRGRGRKWRSRGATGCARSRRCRLPGSSRDRRRSGVPGRGTRRARLRPASRRR
jgi:cystathionine gamma-synthase